MRLTETPLAGAFIIDPLRVEDDRGFFARTWSSSEFVEYGLDPTISQCGISWNHVKGTLRGMHFQRPPFDEVKLVRCTSGAIFDVIVDMRKDSPTFSRWFSVELTAANRRMLYIPKVFAHGFITLTDATEVTYQLSATYSAAHAVGVRWNDPAFGIKWPTEPVVMAARDRDWPDFDPQRIGV